MRPFCLTVDDNDSPASAERALRVGFAKRGSHRWHASTAQHRQQTNQRLVSQTHKPIPIPATSNPHKLRNVTAQRDMAWITDLQKESKQTSSHQHFFSTKPCQPATPGIHAGQRRQASNKMDLWKRGDKRGILDVCRIVPWYFAGFYDLSQGFEIERNGRE